MKRINEKQSRVINERSDSSVIYDSSYSSNLRTSILLGTADINIIYQSDHLVLDGIYRSCAQSTVNKYL